MHRTARRGFAITVVLAALGLTSVRPGLAEHESTNVLAFAPIAGSPTSGAAGTGVVEFKGTSIPRRETRWTVTFRFTGLAADAAYVVVVQGRFGDDSSADAGAFTPLCGFRTDHHGEGGCWDYPLGLRRLGIAQLRAGNGQGTPVLQATRAPGGPGAITSVPNSHSQIARASPVTSPAAASPPASGFDERGNELPPIRQPGRESETPSPV